MEKPVDVAVVGGGIVGLATAWTLARGHRRSVLVLEAEGDVARHQTGHNSGVIHSGLYYKPGSLKARNCARGRELLYRFCAERGLPHERCGKLVVAVEEAELPRLDALAERGRANGLVDLERLGPERLREREPHVAGRAGLLVPATGIVDYVAVCRALRDEIVAAGGEVRIGHRVEAVRRTPSGLDVAAGGATHAATALVNCAGLESDRVATLCGLRPTVRIVPFRGDYFDLVPERRELVRHLIYPVPDPELPFLGVHFTRRVDGSVEAGPNAVLSWKREGYSRTAFSLRDATSTLSFPGFWRMAPGYLGIGLAEYRRAWSQRRFVAALQRLVPEVREGDVVRGGCGVRAQALDRSGKLVDDFVVLEAERMVHVLNAPSPAATASLAIGETIAERVLGQLR